MDSKLKALKLVLDELELESSINSIKDRMRIQKAIYLSQIFGVDFGYRYNWYLKGPYSPALAADYYELSDASPAAFEGVSLNDQIKERLSVARNFIFPAPDGSDPIDWLEALASADYLMRVSRKSEDEAKVTLQTQKPHLANFIDPAIERAKEIPA